jgi:hypothetical protein
MIYKYKATAISILLISTNIFAQNLILDGRVIPLDNTSNIFIDPNTGDIVASSQDGELVCSSNRIAPVITNFIATPSSIVAGSDVTISWNLTGEATLCTKSGDWSGTFTGSDVTDGNHSKVVSNITNNSVYRLQCSNDTGSSSLVSATVNISTSANCISQPPILNGAEDLTIIANNSPNAGEYDGTYKDFQNLPNPEDGVDWPGNFGDSISLSLNRNMYISAQFTTNLLSERGRFQFSTPGNTQGPASAVTIAISECPGDFTTHLDQNVCLKSVGPSGSMKWATDASASGSYCKLENNTTYYLNIVHSITAADNYSTSACDSTYCGILAVQVEE